MAQTGLKYNKRYAAYMAVANNEESPEEQIQACEKLLKLTGHSARVLRVAKRVAKKLLMDGSQSDRIRKKAEALLESVLSGPRSPERDDNHTIVETPIAAEQSEEQSEAEGSGDFDLSDLEPVIEGVSKFDYKSPSLSQVVGSFPLSWRLFQSLGLDGVSVGDHTESEVIEAFRRRFSRRSRPIHFLVVETGDQVYADRANEMMDKLLALDLPTHRLVGGWRIEPSEYYEEVRTQWKSWIREAAKTVSVA
jgi:hypothetical protein